MSIDTTRRRFLSQAAGVAAGGTVLALATSSPAGADVASDPIYAAIERHKQTAAIYDAAAAQRSGFEDLDMNTEQAKQCSLLDEAWRSLGFPASKPAST